MVIVSIVSPNFTQPTDFCAGMKFTYRKTKNEDHKKKLIFILQPGTIADRELQPIVIPSASLSANLF